MEEALFDNNPAHQPVRELQADIAQCQRFSDITDEILLPLAKQLNAQTASFRQIYSDECGIHMGHNGCLGVRPKNHAEYARHFFRQDPVAQSNRKSDDEEPIEIFTLAERINYSQFVSSTYYQEFFRPNGIHHVLAMKLHDPRRKQTFLFGLHRPDSLEQFSDADATAAAPIAAVLCSTLQRLALEEKAQTLEEILASINSFGKDTNLAILDGNGSVLYASPSVENRWKQGHYQTLVDKIRIACAQLAERAGASSQLTLPSREVIRIDNRGGGFFVVSFAKNQTARNSKLQSLTIREREIASYVADGSPNKEVANILDISVRTVENHLRSIFEKLQINNRTSIVRFFD